MGIGRSRSGDTPPMLWLVLSLVVLLRVEQGTSVAQPNASAVVVNGSSAPVLDGWPVDVDPGGECIDIVGLGRWEGSEWRWPRPAVQRCGFGTWTTDQARALFRGKVVYIGGNSVVRRLLWALADLISNREEYRQNRTTVCMPRKSLTCGIQTFIEWIPAALACGFLFAG